MTTDDFKWHARNAGLFASGDVKTGFRIAVVNITQFKYVKILAENLGAIVSPSTGSFPQLIKIGFLQRIEDL